MTYPSKERYEALYARFLTKGVDYLIDAAEMGEMERVLDLCCGSGRLSRRILENHDVDVLVGVDQSRAMVDDAWWADQIPKVGDDAKKPWGGEPIGVGPSPRVRLCIEPVRVFLGSWVGIIQPFDVVFCQQAVNYWLDANTAEMVALATEPDGGRFVFNTFAEPPPMRPVVRDYIIKEEDGYESRAVEVYYSTRDGMVHHFQSREGWEPHVTKFKWISPQQYEEWLSPHFTSVARREEGHSVVYICTRR
jgi:SAM-dependent methyltransferase